MNRQLKISRKNLFYIAVFLYVLANNIQLSYMYTKWAANESAMLMLLKILRYIAYAICIVRIISLKNIQKIYFGIGILLLIGCAVATITGKSNSPIFYFLFFIAAIKTDFKNTVRVFFYVQLLTFIIYTLFSLTGVLGDEPILQTGRTRAFLGYGWVNRASYCLLFMTIELLYLLDFHISFITACIIVGIDIIIFFFTRTLYSTILTFFSVTVALTHKFLETHRKNHKYLKHKKWLAYVFILSVFVSIILPIIYNENNSNWYLLNRFLTGRLALGQRAIQKYGLHLSGNQLEWVGSSTLLFGLSQSKEYFYVDAGFLNLALEFGLFFIGVISFIYYRCIIKAYKSSDIAMTMCLFLLFILFIFEPYVLDFALNPFPLYFISIIRHKRSTNKIYDKKEIKDFVRFYERSSPFNEV